MHTDGKKRSFFDMVFGEGLPGPGTHQGAIGSLFAANRIKSDFFAPWPFHLGADTGSEQASPGTKPGAIGSLFATNRFKSDFFAPGPFHLGADNKLARNIHAQRSAL